MLSVESMFEIFVNVIWFCFMRLFVIGLFVVVLELVVELAVLLVSVKKFF